MKYIEWDEPVPGILKDGQRTTVNQRIRMSEEDAIKAARHMDPDLSRSDTSLLEDFMLIHWATLKEE